MRRVRSTMGRSGCRKALDETPDQLQPYVGRAYCKTSRKHKADMSQGTGTARRPFLLYLFTEALDQSPLPKSPDVSAFYKYQVCVWYVYTFNREASAKALNRENRLECIRQSIRVRFDHCLRALDCPAWFSLVTNYCLHSSISHQLTGSSDVAHQKSRPSRLHTRKSLMPHWLTIDCQRQAQDQKQQNYKIRLLLHFDPAFDTPSPPCLRVSLINHQIEEQDLNILRTRVYNDNFIFFVFAKAFLIAPSARKWRRSSKSKYISEDFSHTSCKLLTFSFSLGAVAPPYLNQHPLGAPLKIVLGN